MVYKLSPNVIATSSPPIPLAGQWGAQYVPTAEKPLINLAQGVPGNPPPKEFMDRLQAAAADPLTTGYGDLRGDASLRKELVRDVNTVYGAQVQEDECLLTAGCNLVRRFRRDWAQEFADEDLVKAIYAAFVSLCSAGDEVILPSPWYFNNEMTLAQLGITTVPLVCEAPLFLPSPAKAASLITEKTRAIVLVTPNNPTGAIYPPSLIKEFAELAKERGLALILDETYREFIPEGARAHELFADDGWKDVLIQLFSFSKSYAIPGHRLGSIIASTTLLDHLKKTLDCLQICPARPAQRVCEWAIEGTRKWREGVRDDLVERGKLFTSLLVGTGWEVGTVGGYFAYVKHPFPGASSELVASRLGSKVGIVVLPGTFFSKPFEDVNDDRYIRFSIANVSAETLKAVPARLIALNDMWKDF
ncbi:aspartate aminotransferase [Pseudohyphozyma bogoriensis]|nr:aspartate aminotransferase [Pseudohyphozyma bogoriensis]